VRRYHTDIPKTTRAPIMKRAVGSMVFLAKIVMIYIYQF